jgi:hypothetical protein
MASGLCQCAIAGILHPHRRHTPDRNPPKLTAGHRYVSVYQDRLGCEFVMSLYEARSNIQARMNRRRRALAALLAVLLNL